MTIEMARMAYDQARSKLGKVNGKNGPGAEAAYAMSYQRLVRLGEAAQLRGKYR